MIKLKNITNLHEFVEGFDMDSFKSMRNYSTQIRYANEKLIRLISGSARVIYKIDEKRVLKLAKNAKGIAQNEMESDYVLNDWYGDIIAKVLESDNDDRWVVSEYAKKLSTSRFKQLLGISWKSFEYYLNNLIHNDSSSKWYIEKHVSDDEKQILENSEFINQLRDMIGNFDLSPGDFLRLNSYGEIDGRLVITDYGLSKEVYKTHYASKREKL